MRKILIVLLCVILSLILLAPTVTRASTYSDAVLADSPVSYYRLGDSSGTTAVDSSGNSHDGTYSGGFTLGASGAIQGDSDTAASFDGIDANVDLPTLALANTSFSVELWFKPAASPPATQDIFTAKTDYSTGNILSLRVYNGVDLTVDFYNNALALSDVLTIGVWNYIVVTYDAVGDLTTIYVNAAIQGNNDAGPFTGVTPILSVGSLENAWNYTKGDIDEVAIYPEAVDEGQIQAHYVAAGYALSPTATPTQTATITPTPTPAPWVLATLLSSGQTYLISYDISMGDIVLAVIGLIAISILLFHTFLALKQR